MRTIQYWLMKSEPDEYSIDDLAAQKNKTDYWEGIRNYQARNMMRDEMKKGDQVFFYHSNTAEPGIVGIVEIVKEAYPDSTALDPDDKHFDPRSTSDKPRWYRVDVKLVRKLNRKLLLSELKNHPQLQDFALVKKGNRLSIMPVTAEQWEFILTLE